MIQNMNSTTYTIRPTGPLTEDIEGGLMTPDTDVDDFLMNNPLEAEVVAICRDEGWTGAHMFVGAFGPIRDAEGREENYCGWIDAR